MNMGLSVSGPPPIGRGGRIDERAEWSNRRRFDTIGLRGVPIAWLDLEPESRPMKELTLSYPDDLASVIDVPQDELPAHLRLMAALKMFELGKLSIGKAAELVGMSKLDFIEVCSLNRISPFNYPDDEVEAELLADLKAGRGQLP